MQLRKVQWSACVILPQPNCHNCQHVVAVAFGKTGAWLTRKHLYNAWFIRAHDCENHQLCVQGYIVMWCMFHRRQLGDIICSDILIETSCGVRRGRSGWLWWRRAPTVGQQCWLGSAADDWPNIRPTFVVDALQTGGDCTDVHLLLISM